MTEAANRLWALARAGYLGKIAEAEQKQRMRRRSELKTAWMEEYEEFIERSIRMSIALGREEEQRRIVKLLLRKGVDRKTVREALDLTRGDLMYLEGS